MPSRHGSQSVAQGGVEPPASFVLSEGGLPVAYQAACCALSKSSRVPGGSRTRLSGLEERRLGRSATGTSLQRKEWESNPQGSSLARVPTGCRRPSGLPFRQRVARACRETRTRTFARAQQQQAAVASRMLQGLATLSKIQPTKKARGRVTPGLSGFSPNRFKVTGAADRWAALTPENRLVPLRAFDAPQDLRDSASSSPLLCPPTTRSDCRYSPSPSRTIGRRPRRREVR